DLLRPLRSEILIGAGLQPHGLAAVVLIGKGVPVAALYLDRGDLILPARLTELRLLVAGGHAGTAEVRVGVDRHLAGRLRRLLLDGRLLLRRDGDRLGRGGLTCSLGIRPAL